MFKYFKTKVLLQQRIQSIAAFTLYFYLLLICPIATNAQQSGKIPISSSIQQLQDPEQRLEAIQILMNLGKLAVPDLIKALQNNNAQVRADAAFVLERIAREAESATPALMAALQDSDASVRENAVSALHNDKSAAPALIKALEDNNAFVVIYAAIALFNFNIETETASDILIHALEQIDVSKESSVFDYVTFFKKIGTSFQRYPDRLSINQLDKAIYMLENIFKSISSSGIDLAFIREPIETLKQERLNRK